MVDFLVYCVVVDEVCDCGVVGVDFYFYLE